MKAEERHRLHENELRRLAEHARERSRPFFDRYGTALLLGLAGVLLIAAIAIWWFRSGGSDDSRAWSDLAAAFRNPDATAEDFADVAELHPGTKAAAWAKVHEAEARLDSGIQSLFSDKEGAARDLEDAQKAFETVLEQRDAGSELNARALYGLAKTLEAGSKGDVEPALERYEQVVDQYPGSVYEGLARQRVEALKSPDAAAFYKWFATAKPALRDPLTRPQDRPTSPFAPPGTSGPALGAPGGSVPSAGGPIEAPKPTASAPSASAPETTAPQPTTPEPDATTPEQGTEAAPPANPQ
jgi:tetratricopeptide (TPR) repeat protein